MVSLSTATAWAVEFSAGSALALPPQAEWLVLRAGLLPWEWQTGAGILLLPVHGSLA